MKDESGFGPGTRVLTQVTNPFSNSSPICMTTENQEAESRSAGAPHANVELLSDTGFLEDIDEIIGIYSKKRRERRQSEEDLKCVEKAKEWISATLVTLTAANDNLPPAKIIDQKVEQEVIQRLATYSFLRSEVFTTEQTNEFHSHRHQCLE